MDQYQHLTQRAYLEAWKLDGRIYLIDSKTEAVTVHQSAKRLLGMTNIQTQEMEEAFADVESCVGHIHEYSLINDHIKIQKMARWVALHAVRCKRYLTEIAGKDYRPTVDNLTGYFLRKYAYFITSLDENGLPKPSFITCDNPCLYLQRDGKQFWIVPLSPYKYVSFTDADECPESPPWDINKNIRAAATDHCVSFNSILNDIDPRPK